MIKKNFIYHASHQIFQSLIPSCCILCDAKTNRNIDLCHECENNLPWIQNACLQCGIELHHIDTEKKICGQCLISKPYYDKTIALFHYVEPIPRLITQLKFKNNLVYAKLFGELLANTICKTFKENKPEFIIPVPLHKKRLHERGFNQALEIARPLSKLSNIPIDIKICQRIKKTEAQSSIPSNERKINVKNAFAIHKNFLANHIAIVDDVVTTGNTVLELSRCLKKAGAQKIDVWCIARTNLT